MPDLICSDGRTVADIIWNGLPGNDIWKVDPNTYAPDFVISVSATCGSVELWDVPCGTVKVVEAVSSSSAAGTGSSSSAAGTGSSSSAAGTGSSSSAGTGSSSSAGTGSSSSAGNTSSSSSAGNTSSSNSAENTSSSSSN